MARRSEELRKRLDELIQRCEAFREAAPGTPIQTAHGQAVRFKMAAFEQWRFLTSSLQTVKNACGVDSPHLRELEICREEFLRPDGALNLDICRGVLHAARDDLDAGVLMDMRQLVTAETFGDLLESATSLLEDGHHLPAVALAGAVLESSLRALAKARAVPWLGESSLTKLNVELYKANVYDKVVYGEIEAWGKLRNKVDHGDFVTPDEVEPATAARMLDGVRNFAASFR